MNKDFKVGDTVITNDGVGVIENENSSCNRIKYLVRIGSFYCWYSPFYLKHV